MRESPHHFRFFLPAVDDATDSAPVGEGSFCGETIGLG